MVTRIEIAAFIAELKRGVPLFDVRSPKEFNFGHMPGAISFPLLNDDERHEVGITYKNEGHDAAVKLGFRLVGHKFINYIEAAQMHAVDGAVCLYCWRGGLRSNTMAWLLSSVGLKVYVLEGGYKRFRNWCLDEFRHEWPLVVLSGRTGAGKTEVLQALKLEGGVVIDLEKLASHRGSAFGALGLPNQPTQEDFENTLAWHLGDEHGASQIWVENESRFIGRLRIPDDFFIQMKKRPMVTIDRDLTHRAERVISEYGNFDRAALAEKTQGITKRMGGDRVKVSLTALEAGDMIGWVLPLLDYYDRNYDHSIQQREGKYERIITVREETVTQLADLLLTMKF